MPKIQQINFTGADVVPDSPSYRLRRWPYLTKIAWNGLDVCYNKDTFSRGITLGGLTLRHCNNLWEIYMDDSCFLMELRHVEGRPNQFIFHIDVAQNWNDCHFVWNAPSSLKWFRSDRTHDNIRILKKERGSTGRMNRITIKDIEYFSFFF